MSSKNKKTAKVPVKITTSTGLKLYTKTPYVYRKIHLLTKKIKKIVLVTAIGSVIVFAGHAISIDFPNTNVNALNDVTAISNVSNQLEDNSIYENNDSLIIEDKIEDNIFSVGSDEAVLIVKDFLNSETGSYVNKYSKMYGVPSEIIASICMQETSLEHDRCIPGGDRYCGYGVGIGQLEQPSGDAITCYNYDTQEFETDYITMENACNVETNIKLCCMLFQNSLNNNNGNVLLAIQAHNYGQGMLDSILQTTYGDDCSQIKSDYNNVEWLDLIKNAHINPQTYVPGWEEEEYGDGNYIEHVLRFCPQNEIKYKYKENEYTFNLSTLKVVHMDEFGTKIL